MGEVGPRRQGGGWRDGPQWGRTAPGAPRRLGSPRSRSAMLLQQLYLLLPGTTVQLEGDGFLAAGRLFTGSPGRLLCSGENPFPFRPSMLKVTVNRSPALGARAQTVPVRRTPLDYHVHRSFRCSWSTLDFFSFFLYLSPSIFCFPGDWIMLLVYRTPLLPEFLTVVLPAHVTASKIFVVFYFG